MCAEFRTKVMQPFETGVVRALQYLQEAQDLVEHQQELQVQKARLVEAEGALRLR